MSTLDPSQLPDLKDYVVIITGGHSGIGLATATELARHGAKIYIASRSEAKAEEAIAKIKETQAKANIYFLEMDLTDLSSVKKGAEKFLAHESKLHILVNNAGIMCAPFSLTSDGIEIQLQTNHLSHFYLTSMLLGTLLSTASICATGVVRVINVSSSGHAQLSPKVGFDFLSPNLEEASPWMRYGQSKFAQVVHAKELARKYPSILSVSLHPGTVKTGLSEGPKGTSWWYRFVQPFVEMGAPGPDKGAWGVLWCAAGREAGEMLNSGAYNGMYFEKIGQIGKVKREAESEKMGRRLWEWSEGELKNRGFLVNRGDE